MAKARDSFYKKLKESMDRSFRQMERYRIAEQNVVRQYRGHALSDTQGAEKVVVLNKLQQMVTIYMRLLASGVLQGSIEPKYPDLRDQARLFELATNRQVREVRLERSFRRAVLDAMFGVGITKTCLAEGGPQFEEDGHFYDAGRAATFTVQLRDFVVDMLARDIDEAMFIGDRVWRSTDWIDEHRKIDKNALDEADEDREMEDLGRPSGMDEDTLTRIYDGKYVWNIYLPRENTVMCFVEGRDVPLYEYEFDGPEGGPYDVLSFVDVPGETLGVGAALSLFELHRFENELMRKVSRQANRSKNLVLIEEDVAKAGERVRDANDGDFVTVPVGALSGGKMLPITIGGADPSLMQTLIWADQQFNILGGNLDSLAGLGPQAETAKQDSMIRQSANAILNEMSSRVQEFATSIYRKHALYVWTDPFLDLELEENIQGTNIKVSHRWTPEEREGDYLDYNFTVDVHSMRSETPQEKAANMMGFLTEWALPTEQGASSAGLTLRYDELSRRLAKYRGLPIEDIYDSPVDDISRDVGRVREPPGMKTSRTVNERVSRPGVTPNAINNALLAASAGQKPQNDLAAAIPRRA